MAKVVSNGELSVILSSMLCDPDNSVIDDFDTFVSFVNDCGELIAKYAGGKVSSAEVNNESTNFEDRYMISVARDENCGVKTVWDGFDAEGEL